MSIQEILREFSAVGPVDCYGPIGEAVIRDAEQELGVAFSPQYREFLRVLGCGGIGSESFVGLGGPQYLNIVWLTRRLQDRAAGSIFGKRLLPIRTDGQGNYDCIDLMHPTLSGEYAIVEWLHDACTSEPIRILASDYLSWMRSVLQMASL